LVRGISGPSALVLHVHADALMGCSPVDHSRSAPAVAGLVESKRAPGSCCADSSTVPRTRLESNGLVTLSARWNARRCSARSRHPGSECT
jgi:hypothetical protein